MTRLRMRPHVRSTGASASRPCSCSSTSSSRRTPPPLRSVQRQSSVPICRRPEPAKRGVLDGNRSFGHALRAQAWAGRGFCGWDVVEGMLLWSTCLFGGCVLLEFLPGEEIAFFKCILYMLSLHCLSSAFGVYLAKCRVLLFLDHLLVHSFHCEVGMNHILAYFLS